ncbi:MAG: tRNA glutamyl-Q(34) synthetase GluQRS [Burkholderiaceae bacterium]
MSTPSLYRGRFAPSPTGALHAGSLVAALASWLDARAHQGVWLVRIEDIDPPREVAGASRDILATLGRFGLESDEPVIFQSARDATYQDRLEQLIVAGAVYGCACSRREIELECARQRLAPGVYPGTCRAGTRGRAVRALRLRVPATSIGFEDRAIGLYSQSLACEVGDIVVRRADGLWAYQLAVVADDAEQGITHVVRGADLLDNTPRQIHLQRALGVATPRYLHVPVLTNERGEKLSKQTGARAIDTGNILGELERAWLHLGFDPLGADRPAAFYERATELWRERFGGT